MQPHYGDVRAALSGVKASVLPLARTIIISAVDPCQTKVRGNVQECGFDTGCACFAGFSKIHTLFPSFFIVYTFVLSHLRQPHSCLPGGIAKIFNGRETLTQARPLPFCHLRRQRITALRVY